MDKDVVYIHNGILLGLEKEGHPAFVTTGMDLEGIMLSEISRQRQILYGVTYMWNLSKKSNSQKWSVAR